MVDLSSSFSVVYQRDPEGTLIAFIVARKVGTLIAFIVARKVKDMCDMCVRYGHVHIHSIHSSFGDRISWGWISGKNSSSSTSRESPLAGELPSLATLR